MCQIYHPIAWCIFHVFFLTCFPGYPQSKQVAYDFLEKARLKYFQTHPEQKKTGLISGKMDSILFCNPGNDFIKAEQITRTIGLSFVKEGKYATALGIFNELRRWFESLKSLSIKEKQLFSLNLNIIGAIYEETGLWNEALSLYMNSLQICNSINYDEGKAKIFNNLGKLYYNRNQFAKAGELYKKAIEINVKNYNKPELFNNYNNLAGIYQISNQPMKALEFALIALNNLDINRDFYDLAIIFDNIGNLYQDMKNYPVALSYYQQAASLQKQKSYVDAMIRTYLSMTDLFRIMNLKDSSLFYLQSAEKLSASLGNPSLRVSVLKMAARYHHHQGQLIKSSALFYQYMTLNDSLETLNGLARMEQIQQVYQVINNEKNNQILQQKIDLQQLAIQRQQVMLFAALVIFLLFAFFLFNLQRLRKRERSNNELIVSQRDALHKKEKEIHLQTEIKMQTELDDQNRQLTAYALNLARTNEFVRKTSDELRQVLRETDSKDKMKTEKIRNTISDLHKFSSGNGWEEFRHYFEKVHQSFEKNLQNEFPDLTPKDKKMCALLKLGLTNKDIASITFRELRSVESARNRLRKKLGLPVDINLQSFLSKY